MLVNVEPSQTNRSTGVIVWDFPPAVVLRVDVFVFVKEQASVVVGGDSVSLCQLGSCPPSGVHGVVREWPLP